MPLYELNVNAHVFAQVQHETELVVYLLAQLEIFTFAVFWYLLDYCIYDFCKKLRAIYKINACAILM